MSQWYKEGYDFDNPDDVVLDVEEVVAETPKAWLIKWDGGSRQEWFPKSQCTMDGEELWVPEWLARERNL